MQIPSLSDKLFYPWIFINIEEEIEVSICRKNDTNFSHLMNKKENEFILSWILKSFGLFFEGC